MDDGYVLPRQLFFLVLLLGHCQEGKAAATKVAQVIAPLLKLLQGVILVVLEQLHEAGGKCSGHRIDDG